MSHLNSKKNRPAKKTIPHPVKTEYKTGQDNILLFGLDIHNPVFLISSCLIIIFVILTLVFPHQAAHYFQDLKFLILSKMNWFFLLSVNSIVLFCIYLIISPLGNIRIGGQSARPNFSFLSWVAMLFAAGMGIGLMFFGVAEPVSHFTSSMEGIQIVNGQRIDSAPLSAAFGQADQAKSLAMAATVFHWAIHPWAIYASLALALAFFSFNRGLPLTLRSVFYPVLKDRVWGWWGHIIDILAVFATLFGLATSLGFGTEQVLAGMNDLFGISTGKISKIILISVITSIAAFSVVKGLDGGVKKLSEINIVIAILLLLFVLFFGPTIEIFKTIFITGSAYLEKLIPLSMPFGREDHSFVQNQTAFYWTWWISWSPFVGLFIARISRGRTVREFMIYVILIPSVFCIIWMGVFGGTAISQLVSNSSSEIQTASLELKLFEMLSLLPLAKISSFIGILLVIVFFITSSDSGSLVIDMITAGGKTKVPVAQRIFWCVFEGVVAASLLLVGGDDALSALRSVTISTALPFSIILVFVCLNLYLGLSQSKKALKHPPSETK